MRFSLVLFGMLLCAGPLLPQQPGKLADSLEQALFFTEDIDEQIQLNSELAKSYLRVDPEKSLKFSNRALELASLVRLDKEAAISYYYRGLALSKLYRNPEAVEAFLSSKELFEELEEESWLVDVCFDLGYVYKNSLDFDKALSGLLKGLAIAQEMGNVKKTASFLNEIGGVYYDQNDYANAFEYYKRSMVLWEDLGNRKGMAIQYNNIGEIYRHKGELERALSYYRKAVSFNKEVQNYIYLCVNYDNIGNVFLLMEQYDSAAIYLRKSLEIAQSNDDPHLESMVNVSLGFLLLKNKGNELAISHFQKAYEFSERNQLNDHAKDAAFGLSLAYADKQDYQKALNYYKKYKVFSDLIFDASNSGKVAEVELKLKFENEQKLKEIHQQRTRFLYLLFALGLFGLIVIIVMLYGRLKINIRHSKSKAVNLYLENKHLEEDIDFKNRELTTNVMYLLKKNELINYISDKLLKAKARFKSQNQPIIREILLDLQSNINLEIWSEFEKRFRAVHKGFYDKLNMDFPKLTDADKKLCALLRLNLSTKEIAAISHQNPNSVEVARTRLRKKLDLSNKDVGLVSFLSNL